jgi:hypothetical protein
VKRAANLYSCKLALVLVLVCLPAVAAGAADRQDLLGTWYGETQDRGQVNGVPYDMRRWTMVQTPDGTGLQVMRYYLGSTFQAELVMSYLWGIDNDILWTECVTVRDDGGLQDCSRAPRSEYRIEALDSAGMRYTSVTFGHRYSMEKVPRDFTFPRQ